MDFGDGDYDDDQEVVMDVLIDQELRAAGVNPDDADDEQYEAADKRARKKYKKMPREERLAIIQKARESDVREELTEYVAYELMKEQKIDEDNATMEQWLAAKKAADQRVAPMTLAQREEELKRYQEQEEKELEAAMKAEAEAAKTEAAAAKARGETPKEDPSETGLSGSQTGFIVLLLLVLFGWKSILFAILAAAMAYRTAAGSVWG
jgi:hypothetical protein